MNYIQSLQQRFTIGNDSPLPLHACPKNWQPLLEKENPETFSIAALALLSHYQALAEQPRSPQKLEKQPLLQPLALPPVPAKHHIHLEQALHYDRAFPFPHDHLKCLLYFLSDRGYSLPVHFWGMIPKNIYPHLPSLYAPWLTHVEGKNEVEEVLNAENWDDFPLQVRLNVLENLRDADRVAFRALVESCLGREKAPQRLEILNLFAQGLCPEDMPFLQMLLKDRAKNVVQLAENFLLRLEPPTGAEMTEVVKKTRSFLRFSIGNNQQKPEIHAKKTNSERNHFMQNLSVVDLEKLAETFKLSLLDFALALDWYHFYSDEVLIFIERLSHLFSPQELSIFIRHQYKSFLLKPHWSYHQDISDRIFHHLSSEEKLSLTLEMIKQQKKSINYSMLLTIYRGSLPEGSLTFEELKNTASWRTILKAKNTDQLIAVGLLFPASVIKEILQSLEGHLTYDREILSFLRLNIALS